MSHELSLTEYKNTLEKVLRAIMLAFDAVLIDFDVIVQTVAFPLTKNERKEEVVSIDDVGECPLTSQYLYRLHITGTAQHKKQKMGFFFKFLIGLGEVRLESYDVYDTKTAKEPPIDGENVIKRALRIFWRIISGSRS